MDAIASKSSQQPSFPVPVSNDPSSGLYDHGVSRPTADSTPALVALRAAGVPFSIHEYQITSDVGGDTYGEAVAKSLGVSAERLFKTLVAAVDGEPVVAIVPVSARLFLKGLARAAGAKKAEMASPSDAERWTGYVTGGISPFGQRRRLAVFVDESIELFESVLASAGRRGLQVEVAPRDLIDLLEATVADLTE